MRVLVACEFSGTVRDAFVTKGHDAWSCDILPTEKPGQHIQGDALEALKQEWDLVIAHPPCTYLSYVGSRHWNRPGRAEARDAALAFMIALYDAPVEMVAVENPVGWANSVWRKPDQIVHPYYFGEPVQKRTCLWLRGLPKLIPTNMLPKPEPLYFCKGPKSQGKAIHWTEAMRGVSSKDRGKARSKTFQGIADAMAAQWG